MFSNISDSTSSFSSKSGMIRHVRPPEERYNICEHWSVYLVGMIRHWRSISEQQHEHSATEYGSASKFLPYEASCYGLEAAS